MNDKIFVSNYELINKIGSGSFGEVYLVEKKNNGCLYAMKVLSKDKIMGQNIAFSHITS
jgi:serine/threonine protein kinase